MSMDFFKNESTGSLKYSPNIAAEKITETTSQAFFKLCGDKEGRELASTILDNYITNEQGNSEQLSERHAFVKEQRRKGVFTVGGEIDED
jgi:hypothetical protein